MILRFHDEICIDKTDDLIIDKEVFVKWKTPTLRPGCPTSPLSTSTANCAIQFTPARLDV